MVKSLNKKVFLVHEQDTGSMLSWEPASAVQKAAEADEDTEDQKAADKNGDVKDLEKAESGASRTSNMVLTGLLLSILLSMS